MSTPGGVNGTVCNTQQYQQFLSNKSHPTITCLTHGQSIGLTLTAEASFLSLAAVMAVLVLIVLSIFAYDILQALGGIFDVRWAHDGIVTAGPYCTVQGIIQQSGELGVALFTLASLWKVGIGARHFAFGVVALASLFVALWVGIGNGIHKNFETPTPYWCWIGPEYNAERLGGEYVWIWIALFASVIMYIPLYFWTKGRLSVDPDKWYKFRLSESDDEYPQRQAALGMLFYPLGYSLVVLPLSVVRWSLSSHKNVPSAAAFFAVSMFNLSGAINVLLFLIVRPRLLLFSPPEEFSEAELGHPTTDSTIFPDTAKYSHSQQPTGMGLADDAGDGVWNPIIDGNNVALSRINSRPSTVDNSKVSKPQVRSEESSLVAIVFSFSLPRSTCLPILSSFTPCGIESVFKFELAEDSKSLRRLATQTYPVDPVPHKGHGLRIDCVIDQYYRGR
ncbi:hypothetical protein EDB86DRAFT_2827471 [Lactarius hatsudake]|nr:hypothetical protein EDB86DRAFT_2827471 [Lactarius hatsudake]